MAPRDDPELEDVFQAVGAFDPTGARTAGVLRYTLDQLYDGQRTGRYRWDQLHKTEKTHCGTLVEINMQREFLFDDGETLDFTIDGIEVDCKYSQKKASWMIPLEARGKIILGLWASDQESKWSMGVVRAKEELLGKGGNRDRKTSLNAKGRDEIEWLFDDADLPPNVLLHLPNEVAETVMSGTSGAKRIRDLFKFAQNTIISRTTIETVAQQKDPMKRLRANGGARTTLGSEGIVILGQYESHRELAAKLDVPIPRSGETVSCRLSPATTGKGALIDEGWWKVAAPSDAVCEAPILPRV